MIASSGKTDQFKGIGKVYRQAVVDTCGSYAFGYLHAGKRPVLREIVCFTKGCCCL